MRKCSTFKISHINSPPFLFQLLTQKTTRPVGVLGARGALAAAPAWVAFVIDIDFATHHPRNTERNFVRWVLTAIQNAWQSNQIVTRKTKQGRAVETESCGGTARIDFQEVWNTEGWECRHGTTLAAARPEVTAQIGVQCRCGCIINFGNKTLNKILAANTQACPGRSFWLLQVNPAHVLYYFYIGYLNNFIRSKIIIIFPSFSFEDI